jgi:hypothetical protein
MIEGLRGLPIIQAKARRRSTRLALIPAMFEHSQAFD